MGFDISHQHVGLNRVGVFLQTARTKGPNPTPDPSPFHREGRTSAQKLNEPWRRISDLVGRNAETRDPKVRKRCVRNLVAWIDQRVSEERAKIESREVKRADWMGAWGENVSEWRRVSLGGLSVEAICFRLGISRGRLTGLLKESMSVSAGELIDGFKIRGLRKLLLGHLREAAARVWGCPGDFAVRRCGVTSPPGPLSGSQRGGERRAGGTPALHKRTRYFRTSAAEFLGREGWEEEGLRVSELLGALDSLREENDFRLGAFVTLLGFETVGKFRAACLTVMGRTLEQLERLLAREIVHYYLAAEDFALRKLARRADELGMRAREIYWGCESIPEEPYLDRWSAFEAAKPGWLKMMREEFG